MADRLTPEEIAESYADRGRLQAEMLATLLHAEDWNLACPVGMPVVYWPGERTGPGTPSVTRSPAWVMASGAAVVAVDGYPGGIALTHVEAVFEDDTDSGTPAVEVSR